MGNCPTVFDEKMIRDIYLNEIDLFVIGKTGHGKSSTANTLVGQDVFRTSDNAESETSEVSSFFSYRCGRVIKVVDGPGLQENRMSSKEAGEKMIKDMSKAVAASPRGFHALLLVLRYGTRFTEEELNTVKMLKSMLGQDFVKNYCIIIFTHGEDFDLKNKKNHPDRTFDMWLKEQRGALQTLLQECDNRVLLFYNVCTENSDEQVMQLLHMAEKLKHTYGPYTNEMFQEAKEIREKFIHQTNTLKFQESIQANIDLLWGSLETIKDLRKLTPEAEENLNFIKSNANDLLKEIEKVSKGTIFLEPLKENIHELIQCVEDHHYILKEKQEDEEIEAHVKHVLDVYNARLTRVVEDLEPDKQSETSAWDNVVENVDWQITSKLASGSERVSRYFWGTI